MNKIFSSFLVLTFFTMTALAAGRIQNEDVKSLTDLTNAGGSVSQLINDSKIYVTGNGINDQLSNAITNGLIGGGGSGGINLLTAFNPGFEAGTGSWTASAGTFTATSTAANVGVGLKAGSWVTGGSARTLKSTLATIPAGLYGQNGLAYCRLQTAATDFTLAATDGTNVLASTTITGAGASQYAYFPLNFVFPTSGSAQIVLTSNSSQTVFVDDCYLGSAQNLSNVSQTQMAATVVFPANASCQWVAASGFANFAAVSGCSFPAVTGIASAVATKIPAFNLNNMPPGTYEIEATVNVVPVGTSDMICRFIDDLSNVWGTQKTGASNVFLPASFVGFFTYNTAQSQRVINFQCSGTGNNVDIRVAPLTITVKSYPLAAQLSQSVGSLGSNWAGYHDNTCSWARTNTTYGDPTVDASCALVERQNQNFGTVSASGSVLPAITFTPARIGRYLVCAYPKVAGGTLASTVDVRLWDGTTTIAEGQRNSSVASDIETMPLCGVYTVTTAAPVTLSLQTKATSGSVTIAAGASNASALEWSLVDITQNVPTPILVGSVTSNTAGTERIERAKLTCSFSSSITSQSGSWISSIGNVSSGVCAVNFAASAFTTAPSCVVNRTDGGASSLVASTSTSASTSTVNVRGFDSSANTNATTFTFDILCMGAK